MKIQFGSFEIKAGLVPVVAFLCLLPLLVSLGFWQLGRAQEKRDWLEKQNRRFALPAIEFDTGVRDDLASLEYRKVQLTGRYDRNHQFLIDNQILDGRAGYFVLTPLRMDGNGKAVLVNRGWVPADYDRTKLPDLFIHDLHQTVVGRIQRFPGVGLRMENMEIPSAGWPSRVQLADSLAMAKKLQYPLFDFQVLLNPEMPEGYRRVWSSVSTAMPPEKHVAYAIQWFALAITLTILFFWSTIEKKTET
ncbi:MAG: SURF1 family protein [Gammaproteobacteria bacterium]